MAHRVGLIRQMLYGMAGECLDAYAGIVRKKLWEIPPYRTFRTPHGCRESNHFGYPYFPLAMVARVS